MASEQVNLVALIYPQPDKLEELSGLIAELTRKVQETEPDTLIYYAYVNEAKKDEKEIIVVERYRNGAALQVHAQGPHFKAFVAKAAPLMAKPFELKKADGILPASVGVARL
ncbi:hypothetical protein LTS12_028457 [Elasticomyces elasticus]|nr:hypothetical protein LTS12_028457 [Elasticomyces elasticus]